MSQIWTWRHAIWEADLAATTKLVLQALASHLNDMGGPMFPSQERLAKLCSLSERAIITHLDVAEEKGWIVVRKRELNGKRWAANEYVARFPDGVNKVHPTSDNGVNNVQSRGERRSGDGVKDVHTNSPSEHSKESSSPEEGVWEEDESFMQVVGAYAKVDASRVDHRKAFGVWTTKALKKDAQRILAALPVFAASKKWKDGYAPNLSRWLGDGGWKQVAQGCSPPEVLKEQYRIIRDGMAAYHRVEWDKKRGAASSAADVAAVSAWQEQQARLSAATEAAR